MAVGPVVIFRPELRGRQLVQEAIRRIVQCQPANVFALRLRFIDKPLNEVIKSREDNAPEAAFPVPLGPGNDPRWRRGTSEERSARMANLRSGIRGRQRVYRMPCRRQRLQGFVVVTGEGLTMIKVDG